MAKTEFKQELSSASANAVYLLKTEDDIITGILSLEQGGDVNKHIANLQEHLYTMADVIGIVGENDPNAKIYASTEYIANGDNRKVAIEKLDAQAKINANNIASNLILINQNASDIADIIASLGVDSVTAPLAVGIATLDADGKIPVAQMPNALLQYQGTWDASTNTPTLADGTGTENYWYRVTVAGTQDLGSGSITYAVGDKIVHNGTIWQKWDTNDEVTSVFGRTGDVTAQPGDYSASDVGLGNVTNDAQLKRAAADFDTFTEKVDLVENDIILIEDSEDSLNKKKAKLSNLIGGAGGGGSFIFELTGDVSPLESSFKGISLLDFDFESEMEVLALVTVPDSYKPGDQIALENAKFYTASSSGDVYFRCNTSLVKPGTDITTALNEHLSVNPELSLSSANKVKDIGPIDLTSDIGQINAIAVLPGDMLIVKLFRDNSNETTSAVDDARFIKFSPSINYKAEIIYSTSSVFNNTQYMKMNTPKALDTLSISFWFKMATTTDSHEIFLSEISGYTNTLQVWYNHTNETLVCSYQYNGYPLPGDLETAGAILFNSGSGIDPLGWNHVTVAIDQVAPTPFLRFVLNGSQVFDFPIQGTAVQFASGLDFNFGAGEFGVSPEYVFNGKFSNIEMWETALSTADALALYNAGYYNNPEEILPSHTLMAHYLMGDSPNDTTGSIKDQKGTADGSILSTVDGTTPANVTFDNTDTP